MVEKDWKYHKHIDWLENESSLGCIPNVVTGTNNTAHNATPTISPVIIP